jgi:TorA maturation chaperone TorD
MPTPSERLKSSPRRSVFGNYGAESNGASVAKAAVAGLSQDRGMTADCAPALQTAIDRAVARSFIHRFLAKAFEDGEPESWHWLAGEQTKTSLAAAFRALQPCTPARSPGAGEIFPDPSSHFEPPDHGRRGEEAGRVANQVNPPRGQDGCDAQVHGERAQDALTNSFHQLERAFVRSAGDSFALAYVTCFGHTVRGDCPMNEIEYGDIKADPLFQPHRLADLGAFYAAFGLGLASDAGERIDHISIQLEFMSVLAAKEAYAMEHQFDAEQLDLLRDAQKKFLREHLGRWTPAFTRRLAKLAEGTPLATLARFTGEFVKLECGRFNVPPGSEDLLLRPVDEAGESLCASCGITALPPGATATGPI